MHKISCRVSTSILMTNQLHWQRSPQSLTCQCFTATTLSSNQMSSSYRHTVKWNMLHKILFRSGFLDEACQLDGTLPHVFLTCNKASSCLSVTPSPADFHIFVSVEKDCSEGQGKSGSGVFSPRQGGIWTRVRLGADKTSQQLLHRAFTGRN